ncbi:gamma-glutamyltransferase family protein [Bordetella genomosp. 6]|uniref:gamma-glutamyltransferase family protein n=1 Tax=Bordetella genomosp. 6 TaxID=463024 RepID=UPI000A29425F|nr:gamma-glutamyltransferase family protein [Bordetella genomosp. 6]ARP75552.1 gamma-glutamyltransferase [Bordetella genomosp. 6]
MSVDAFATGQSATSTYTAHRPVIAANRHAVSSGHYLASHAAFQILESGGNAVDAGVAAGLVLGVVHSDQVNIAGVAPMMIYLAAEDRVITIDGLGSWPAAASCERFEREFGGVVPEGLLRTVIPAAPGAWITALQRYGTRSFAEVAQYAIRFAREGFIMYPFLADRLQEAEAKYRRWPSNAAIYLPGGRPPRVGERFVQSDLAASLQYMADQETATAGSRIRKLQAARDAFYQGDIAGKIVAFHQENGGLLTAADLAGYAPTIEAPLSTRYGDMDVYACNFWCQGPALLQALNILKSFDLKEMGHNSTRYIHHVAEALKLTFADREHYYADPRFIDVPAQTLLSDAYARQRAQLVRADRAWPEMPPCGEIAGYETLRAIHGNISREIDPPLDTSYVCVVDRHGNAFSATPSDVSSDTIVIPGTGLCPSSRGSQSRADSSHPASLAPGKRPRLTPNPAMAIQRGKRILPLGSPGGDSQVQAMLQVLLNITLFDMDPQTAIEAPRFISYSHPDSFAPHAYYPGRLSVEGRIPAQTEQTLAALGHDMQRWPDWLWRAGGVCAIDADLEQGIYQAGADPRRAAAYALGW